MTRPRLALPKPATLIALLLPAVLFWLTLYPGVGGRLNPGKSANLQFIGQVLGVPEAPGYPQYVLLNYLWTSLPFPWTLAVQANLLSVVFAVFAAGILFTTAESVTGNKLAALLAVWATMLSRTIWTISTEANTDALHLVYVSALLLFGTAWARTQAPIWLAALLSACALGLGNDTAIVTFIPSVAFLIVLVPPPRRARGRWLAVVVGVTAVGISQYALLWWRSHTGALSLQAVSANASLGQVADAALATSFDVQEILRSGLTNMSLDLLVEANAQFLLPALLVAAWGFAVIHDRKPALAWFWGVAWLSGAAHASAYGDGVWSVYCAPVWLITGLFLAVGLARAMQLADRLSVIAVLAVIVALAWNLTSNLTALRLAESPHDLSLLIRTAGSEGVVVTSDRNGYKDKQIRDYYRFGLGTETTGPTLLSATTLVARQTLLLSDRPIYYHHRPEFLSTDVVVLPAAGDATDWVSALPAGTLVAVIATDPESPTPRSQVISTRAAIADALAPLGIGGPLLDTTLPLGVYVALAVKGALDSRVEISHPNDAILDVLADERLREQLRSFLKENMRLTNTPTPFELYAGREREGPYNRLTLGGREDLSRRPEIRIFAIQPTADLEYQVVRFDSASSGALLPYFFVSGTRTPVKSLSIRSVRPGTSTIEIASKPIVNDEHADAIAAVVGCAGRRLKVATTFSLHPSQAGLRRLRRFVRNTQPGDWLTLRLNKPPTNAEQETVSRIFRKNNLPAPDWQAVRRSLVIVVRPGTEPLQFEVHPDPQGTTTIALPCTPLGRTGA